jgi:hypothetical protein
MFRSFCPIADHFPSALAPYRQAEIIDNREDKQR